MRSIGITGTGSYLPEKILTNYDLARMVDTTDEWIFGKTGIRERRVAAAEEATSDLAAKAGLRAIEAAGISKESIDLIVVATSSPDMIQPATACMTQNKMGINNFAAAFDLSAVCSGFAYALAVASDMMKGNPHYKNVLVIAAETYSRILNYKDRTTCVFFGDGAGAVVLSDVRRRHGILSSEIGSDGSYWDVIKFPAGGSRYPTSQETLDKQMHAFTMDGKKVWDFAIEAFPNAIRKALKKAGKKVEDLDLVISHQANINIIKASMLNLGLPMEKTFTNIEKYGNTSGASAAIALDEAYRAGRLKKGDLLAIVGFGGGLTWGADIIRWTI